jgi:TonB family protein
MKNILMGVVALTIGCAMFALLPAQEPGGRGGAKTKGVAGGPYGNAVTTAISGTTVTGAPYSAVAITDATQTLGDGNRIVHSVSQKIYRDTQGRERSEETSGSAVISDPVAKVSYRLNAQTRTATQMPLMSLIARSTVNASGEAVVQARLAELAALQAQVADLAAAQAARAAAAATGEAPVKETLAPQNLEGVLSNGTRTTITIPAGQVGNERPIHVVDEVWYSPELQLNVRTVHSDPRGGETVYRLTQIIRSEPDPRLFQVPSDYTITNAGGGRSGGGGRGVPNAAGPVPQTTAARPGLTVVSRVEPQYSEEARNAKWQGTVTLRLTVDEAGVPHNIAVFKSLGMGLDQKAIEAVSQWRFQPTLLNGAPTQVTTTIDVSFKLQ